jgi:CRISPR system Cascade subunit CasB
MEVKRMAHADPFIQFLEEHRDDRALMAALRRGLAQPKCAEVSRIVQCWLSTNSPRWLEDAYYSVAPLFGWYHDHLASEGNMGSHFRALAEELKRPQDDELPRNVERRFMLLLASDANHLDDMLRPAVSLLKSNEIAVHWQQLLVDVVAWKHTDDRRDKVRLQWSREFWRTK